MEPGAGYHNLPAKLASARRKITKTATVTLTADELNFTLILAELASATIALTLPAASEVMRGYEARIAMGNATAVTVVATGSFAGGNATVTLSRGECMEVYCDGTYWYNNSVGASA